MDLLLLAMSVFGMTIYAENVLGIRYRYRDKEGRWIGGAMVYINDEIEKNEFEQCT